MNGERRLLILQIGFAKVFAHDFSRTQFVLPTAQFGFAIYAQNHEGVMIRSPFPELRIGPASQHESRERVAGLHRALRARQIQPREDVRLTADCVLDCVSDIYHRCLLVFLCYFLELAEPVSSDGAKARGASTTLELSS